jgi:hypothetical protein
VSQGDILTGVRALDRVAEPLILCILGDSQREAWPLPPSPSWTGAPQADGAVVSRRGQNRAVR